MHHRAEKKWGPNLQGKFVNAPSGSCQKVHPPRQSKSPIFEEIAGDLVGRRGYLGSFSVCFELLRATTKEVNLLGGRKVHPRQNPGYAYCDSHSINIL